ncbi:MAG TPA: transglutaminase domain-containing protein [Acidimicrobiales bacterium]|nr:transglutaminase domain-containing protein [Acidimicrobiales bacterium]
MSGHRRIGADLVPDGALLTVALAAGLGASRLARNPGAAHVLLPIAACVVTGHVVVSLVRSRRLPDPVPSVTGILAVALVAVWTLLPAATRAGIPTPTTVRVLLHRFTDAGAVIRSHPTPVPATSGVVLCLAAGAGLAAVFARTLWTWQEIRPAGARRPLVALFPTFGLFCYTALLSSDIDRVTGTALYLATALIFLAVADRPEVARRRLSWRSGTAAALAMGAVAVVVPVAASPGLAGLQLDAIPFSHGAVNGSGPGAPGAGAGDVAGVGALDLIDNMRAVLTAQSDLTMFTAVSRTPTYWQVATLTRFDGTSWLPDPATKAAAEDAPQLVPIALPVLTEPVATKTFTVAISIGNLRSNLLPVPPSTVSVAKANSVQVEPGIGVIQPFANPADLTYDATARLPSTADLSAQTSVAALDASAPATDLLPYLALPPVPPAVVQLAHQIVAHARGPAAEATALVRYFTVGKRFRYTLSPPPVSGRNALSSFLFTTRAGFCQQFAGAYAVLARIDGLPTRLAIGFTTGSTEKRDTYSVAGADAHSWPQVYLGPAAGWVSFEPTPATTDEALGAGVENGAPTTTPSSHPTAVTTTTLSDKRLQGTGITAGAGTKGLGPTATPATTTPHHAAWGTVVLVALAAAVLIVTAAVAGPGLWRRRRPRLRRRSFARLTAPGTEILARWEQAAAVLARTGLGRRESETLEEHATRLVSRRTGPTIASVFGPGPGAPPGAGTPGGRALEAYRALAALAGRASYAPDPCTEADLAEARRLSEELRAALRRGAPVDGATSSRP